jgi:hypothetical protein
MIQMSAERCRNFFLNAKPLRLAVLRRVPGVEVDFLLLPRNSHVLRCLVLGVINEMSEETPPSRAPSVGSVFSLALPSEGCTLSCSGAD